MSTNDSGIKNWSTNPDDNNSASPDGAPEGTPPSTINNILRQQMADHKNQWIDAQWFTDATENPSFVSGSVFVVDGDLRNRYPDNRRIKAFDGSTLYGTISSSTYTTQTKVTVSLDSGSFTASLTGVAVGFLTASNSGFPEGGFNTEQFQDATVTTDKITNGAVTLDKLDTASGATVFYYGSGGAPSVLTASSSFLGLLTNGPGADPTFEPNPEVSPQLLQTKTITSATSTVSFTSFLDSTEYSNYLVIFNNVQHNQPTFGALLACQFYAFGFQQTPVFSCAEGTKSSGSLTSIAVESPFGGGINLCGTTNQRADVGINGEVIFFAPDVTQQTHALWNATAVEVTTGESVVYTGAAIQQSLIRIDEILFRAQFTHKITGGTFKLYGIK